MYGQCHEDFVIIPKAAETSEHLSAVPPELVLYSADQPKAEALGYGQVSLREKDFGWFAPPISSGIGRGLLAVRHAFNAPFRKRRESRLLSREPVYDLS